MNETDALNRLRNVFFGLADNVETLLLQLGSGIVVLMIIFAGLKYITGDPKGGKSALMAAVIGTAIVLLARVIISVAIDTASPG